jgi:toxin ParE1/3/4
VIRVAWTRRALQHIDAIQDYIAADTPSAAYRVTKALINRTTTLLSETPMAGRLGRAKETRELVFPDLPYIIAYRVRDQIEILAVVQVAQEWPEGFD